MLHRRSHLVAAAVLRHEARRADAHDSGTGASRTYDRLDALVEEVNDARVWGGLHYRTTMEETAKHFPRIAHDVGQKYFLKPKK